jgi:LmbE family N-acetylglucosaminyl deacetylase
VYSSAIRHPGPTPSLTLFRALQRLRTVGTVLYVAAHPDDENTKLLSWLVHHEGVRAGYLSLTRGEGGQNLIGPERAPLLGLIREQELLAARRVDGAEQFFGRCPDFGFSKSQEETLSRWDRALALADIVAVIRRFRPDVILTRFSPDERETHAHHSTSALLAVEAFAAAADPARFPDQLESLSPWQASRVVWNWFTLDAAAPANVDAFFAVEVGGYDPLLGESYPEVAARSLSMHRTQGFGTSGQRGSAVEYFRVLAGRPAGHSIFEGIDRSWARVPGAEALDDVLTRAIAEFRVDRPDESVPILLDALAAMDALAAHPWRDLKRQQLHDVIAGCAAIRADAHTPDGDVVPGHRNTVSLSVIARSAVPVILQDIRMTVPSGTAQVRITPQALTENVPLHISCNVEWSRTYGDVDSSAAFEFIVGGRTITVERPLVRSWLDPIVGERWEPVTVVPAVTVTPVVPVMILPDDEPRVIQVRVRAFVDGTIGEVRPVAPDGVEITPLAHPFALPRAGAEQQLAFTVRRAATGTIRFELATGQAREYLRLDYPHIPPITITQPAEMRLVRFAMTRGGDRIGYIAGAGDEVAQSLRHAGYLVSTVSDDAIEAGELCAYDAVVTGIRAFNTSHHLAGLMPQLMAYVERGGTLVVQYNTHTLMTALTAALGPYALTIGDDRVCEEDARVQFRDPSHPIFTTPNRIGPEDFEGWVQERGLCFSTKWDSRFRPLLSLHDQGEPPRDGGLLVACHGRGRLVYTGLSFFRQLPAGVPGAYRLFANMLARG